MKNKIAIILPLLFCFLVCTQAKESSSRKGKWGELSFSNGVSLKVEVADTMEKRVQGLMHRTNLPKNEGMLFIFQKEKNMNFWMRNTYLALSIAYFDKSKKLKNIEEMKPQNMMSKEQHNKTYPSKGPCLYALEVNKGWFKENKIKPGMSFRYKIIKK